MARKQRILVVEDDAAIRTGLADALGAAGYETIDAADGTTGLEAALAEEIDLLLLDLMLPGTSGLEILAEVRRGRAVLPVIILTAMGAEGDRVKGLDLGADDYVVKPFSLRELLSRVAAVLRRTPGRSATAPRFAVPGGQADLEHNCVSFDDGVRCELSEREMDLLHYLAVNGGRVISRDEILLHVWRVRPRGIETRTIDMHVARLRDKLGAARVAAMAIKTVRGRGYLFDFDPARASQPGAASRSDKEGAP